MVSDLEFRITVGYLLLFFAFPFYWWRETRRWQVVAGCAPAAFDRIGRRVAVALQLVPTLGYLANVEFIWGRGLDLPVVLRWLAVAPAVGAVLLLIWACHCTEGSARERKSLGGGLDLDGGEAGQSRAEDGESRIGGILSLEGPYRRIRHPQLAARSVFFISLAVIADSGLVLAGSLAAAAVLWLFVARSIDASLVAESGGAYRQHVETTGGLFWRLGVLKQAEYTVPRRFGLSAILALITTFGIVFGGLNYMRASPVAYLFVASEIVAICLVQILFGSAPRGASALTGAVLLPFWFLVFYARSQLVGIPLVIVLGGLMFMVALGALLGYCIGALAAGFFLVMDLIDPLLPGAKTGSPSSTGCQPKGPPD